jgi:cytochrome b subunit of formate dehydrogenase
VGIDRLLRLDRWGYLKKLDDMLMKMTRLPPLNRLDSLKDLDSIISVIAKPPRFDRWGYWEKFDFWAVFWGIPLLGVTGLIMAYPLVSTRFIPGWGLNVVFWIHRLEAILAICHVFIIHFFIGHLRRHSFPMDQAMFEGSVDLDAARHEKPAWVERLEQTGELESKLVAGASARRRALFYAFGYVALVFGFFLLIGGLVNSTSITW